MKADAGGPGTRGGAVRRVPGVGDAALALRYLLNPVRRASLPGLGRRHLLVAAVWPERHGFSARLESAQKPGLPVLWVRWSSGLETWPFPQDPALAALETLVDDGYVVLGHRLGRRATLLAADGTHVLYLRPPDSAAKTFARLHAVHAALERAGVPVVRLGPRDAGLGGLRAAHVGPDTAARTNGPPWEMLGAVLARAHAAEPPAGLTSRGTGFALDAVVRQMGMAVHAGTAFTQWLERRLERWRLLGAAGARCGGALVHGDLHPGQVVWRRPPVILDWERAGAGDPEEDLGNLAAHLYWEGDPDGATFAAVRRGYRGAGGAVAQPLFEHYARLALVRVLALHTLREPDQARIGAGRERWAAWPEVVEGW